MAATHTPPRRTRKTRRRPARQQHLPAFSLGWSLIVVLVLIGIARTWPYWTAATVILIGAALILRAIRPARLARLWHILDRAAEHRRALPAPGHRTLQALHSLSPGRFEHAIAELARTDQRVATATAVGGSGDGGMDVRVELKDGTHILVQCKRYKNGNNVPPRDIRDANGAYRELHHCHRAVIVTTSDFSQQAYETNARFVQPLTLVNGNHLRAWANGEITAPW